MCRLNYSKGVGGGVVDDSEKCAADFLKFEKS